MKYQEDLKRARDLHQNNQQLLRKIKRLKPKNLDGQFNDLHEKVFKEIDCLECANCCKTTSPIFLTSDIERIAKTLKMKTNAFIDNYLKIDEDHDYVLQTAPCPFLGEENKCIIYEKRPKACREYPHTNRKKMYQIINITSNNTLICPAVSRIVELLSLSYS